MVRRAFLALCGLMFEAHAQRLAIKTYTTADGLSHNSVHRILADSRGFVWFATAEGLSRFDGYGFTTYGTAQGLPHPNVYSIVETRNGVLWVGTGAGLCRFDSRPSAGSDGRICDAFPIVSGANVEVRALAEGSDGILWAGTSVGLWRSIRRAGSLSFQNVSLPSVRFLNLGVTGLLEDSYQKLWIVTEGGLYRRWPDGRIERYRSALMQGPDSFRTLRGDLRGGLFFCGLGLFSCTPTPTACSGERFWNKRRGLWSDYVMDVSGASGGGAWVVNLDGVSRVLPADSNQARAVAYLSAVDLGDFPLEAVAEDPEGNVWVGSDGGGASRISHDGLVSYSERDGLGSHNVVSIFEDDGGQLFAVSRSRDGLFLNRLLGEKFQAIRVNVDPRGVSTVWHGHYQVMTPGTEGEWWVVTRLGLARFSGIREASELAGTIPEYKLPQQNLIRLYRDRHGNVWITDQHSAEADHILVRWNSKRHAIEGFPPSVGGPNLARDRVNAYAEDHAGNLWLGLERGGLWHLESIRFRHIDLPQDVSRGEINWLHTDREGRLWIASSVAGAGRIDHPEREDSLSAQYTTRQGLSSNEVQCIAEDFSGKIYLGTARGVDRLDPGTGRVQHYTTADGLAHGELQTAFRDRRGWLWFGAQQGLSRLIPAPAGPSKPPPVAIIGISVGGSPVPLSPLGETEISLPDLPHGRDQVQVEFVGLSFRAGEAIQYQYSLEGAANEWSPPTQQRTVTYAGLTPGSYRFLVRAVNSDGLITAQPASVRFTIPPPFWLRWWFVSGALVAFASVAWMGWRYRQKQLAAVHRVRMRIAADLHDDIGSSLSQIAILSELARRAPGNPERNGPLDQIAEVSRELVDSMSDIVWSTDPRRDRLGDLANHLRQHAGEVLGASNIEFHFVTSAIEGDRKLSVNARRQIFLVFKECIHNMTGHSRCTQAQASLTREGNWLCLNVSDNGIGFDVTREHDGHGLASMRERAESLGGEIEYVAGAEGTTIRLRVPLRQ
jgi:signal transduction histidine kinase/ligand-binding sensor domain-containing protein